VPEGPSAEQTDHHQSAHQGQAAGTPETAGTPHVGVSLGARVAASQLFWAVDIQVLHHFLNGRGPNFVHFVDEAKQ
jgi:hypothetical protein